MIFFFHPDLGVGFATRQMGNLVKPNLLFSVDDQGVVSMKSQSTFKTTEIKFKLDEEFDETTADDRKTKVSKRAVISRCDMLTLDFSMLTMLLQNVLAFAFVDRDYSGQWKTRAETDMGWQGNDN